MILALATTGLAEMYRDFDEFLSGPGERCNYWDETTGELFLDCQPGLICSEDGLMSIPGAGNTCQYAQLGEVCRSWNEDTGLFFASCEEGLTCRLTEFSQGGEHTCVYIAGQGETCGWDESTGEPLSVLCEDRLICREDAGSTCQHTRLGEVCQRSWNEDTYSYSDSCEEGLKCRLTYFPLGEDEYEYTCVRIAGLGEKCGGFDESTEESFPDCQPGLVCREDGLMSIPGAGSTCQLAQLGDVCQSWNEDTGNYFASCEEGL